MTVFSQSFLFLVPRFWFLVSGSRFAVAGTAMLTSDYGASADQFAATSIEMFGRQ
jgi:hypothetical protein